MAYSEKIFRDAEDIMAERKQRAETEAEERHDKLAEKCPELLMLEEKMKKSAYGVLKVIGMGGDTKSYVDKLRNENLMCAEEIKKLLVINSYPEDYLEPRYNCSVCSDTGKHNGKLCSCFIDLIRQLSYSGLSKNSSLKISSFEDFDLSYYSYDSDVYKRMRPIFEFCKNYAENFDNNAANILMTGETGLGKTHLSLAIAGEVIKKGYGVVYGSVQNLFGSIEREHFGRSNEKDGTTEDMLLGCDLLILDDLGAEFTTNFTVSVLNNVINSRMLTSKTTIINTNLPAKELADKYSNRIMSRIISDYSVLHFVGKDIRQMKKLKGQ